MSEGSEEQREATPSAFVQGEDLSSDNGDASVAPRVDKHLRTVVARDIIMYGIARILLFVLLTAVIQALSWAIGATIPLVVSALLALIVAFPLSMFVFKKLRARVTQEIAEWDAQRKARKQWIQDELAKR